MADVMRRAHVRARSRVEVDAATCSDSSNSSKDTTDCRLLPSMDIFSQVGSLLFSSSSSNNDDNDEAAAEKCGGDKQQQQPPQSSSMPASPFAFAAKCRNRSLAFSLATLNVLQTVTSLFPGKLGIKYQDPDVVLSQQQQQLGGGAAATVGLVVRKFHLYRVALACGGGSIKSCQRFQTPLADVLAGALPPPTHYDAAAAAAAPFWHYYIVLECGDASFVSFDLTYIQFQDGGDNDKEASNNNKSCFHDGIPLDACCLLRADSIPDKLLRRINKGRGNGGNNNHLQTTAELVSPTTWARWAADHRDARNIIAGFSGSSLKDVRWFHPNRTIT